MVAACRERTCTHVIVLDATVYAMYMYNSSGARMTDQSGPTEVQRKWLKCIGKLMEKHGRPPTYQELADAMGHEQRSVASEMVKRLRRDGWLRVTKRWDITAKGKEWL